MKELILVVVLWVVWIMSSACSLAAPIFLFVDGISGDVVQPNYRDWIDVAEVQIGLERIPTSVPRGVGAASFFNLQVTTTAVSIASPELWQSVANGRNFPKVELAVLTTIANKEVPLVELEFRNSKVMGYTFFSNSEGALVDTADFSYDLMTYRFNQYNNKGKKIGTVKKSWDLESSSAIQSPFSFTSSPSAPLFSADFSGDGQVNSADLLEWQGNFGLNDGSDSNDDGLSNGADFLDWQRQLGSGVTPLSALQQVPEPTSSALVAGGVVVWLLRARRRRLLW